MADEWGIGNQANDKPFDNAIVGVEMVDLVFGQHPHSRCDNNIYARFGSGKVIGFDGKRILTRIEIEEHNYLKQSELSGDEVRSGGSCKIYFDGVLCNEFFHRDSLEACITARQWIREIREHPSGWGVKSERARLVGRKIKYKNVPAIISGLIVSQGCVLLNYGDELKEAGERIKTTVDDPSIWWFRDE